MQFWIEVTGDYQWELRKTGKIGLHCPITTRYHNMIKDIQKGDIILHYCTSMRASNPLLKSSILGLSKTKSSVYTKKGRYDIDVGKTIELKFPIKLFEFSKIENPSKKFKFMINANLQKYIFQIEKLDFIKILKLKKENYNRVLKNKEYRDILVIF